MPQSEAVAASAPGPARALEGTKPEPIQELILLSLMVLAAWPLLAPLASQALWPLAALGPLGSVAEARMGRLITGYVGLAMVLFQGALAVRSRVALLPGEVSRWRSVHRINGVPLLLVLVIHTGGRWGMNLNRTLLAVMVTMMFVTQIGHVAKAWARQVAATGQHEGLDESLNGEEGWIHLGGYRLHVFLALCGSVLLGFHMLAAWYF
jgi:hypothetical protein